VNLKPQSDNSNLKTILVLLILCAFNSELYCVSFPSDTLIIDGKTVSVDVIEGEEAEAYEDELPIDFLASNIFRIKFLSLGYERGFSFNTPSSNGTVTVLDEFIGNKTKGGNFQNIELGFLAKTQKKFWVGANLGIANWDLRHTIFKEDLGPKFYGFSSTEPNVLNRIDTTLANIGLEFDTVNVEVGNEYYFASNVSLGVQLGTELLKKKSSERTKFIGLVGMNIQRIYSYTVDEFHFLNEETWFTENSESIEKNQFEFSATLKLLMMHQVRERVFISPSILFTERFTPAFSNEARINFRRRGVGLGFFVSWKL